MTEKKRKTPIYLIDTSSDFYRPLSVRIGICIAAALWAAIEVANGDSFWMVLSGAMLIYSVYVLFITYTPPIAEPKPAEPDDDDTPDDAPKP